MVAELIFKLLQGSCTCFWGHMLVMILLWGDACLWCLYPWPVWGTWHAVTPLLSTLPCSRLLVRSGLLFIVQLLVSGSAR